MFTRSESCVCIYWFFTIIIQWANRRTDGQKDGPVVHFILAVHLSVWRSVCPMPRVLHLHLSPAYYTVLWFRHKYLIKGVHFVCYGFIGCPFVNVIKSSDWYLCTTIYIDQHKCSTLYHQFELLSHNWNVPVNCYIISS